MHSFVFYKRTALVKTINIVNLSKDYNILGEIEASTPNEAYRKLVQLSPDEVGFIADVSQGDVIRREDKAWIVSFGGILATTSFIETVLNA